MHLINFMIDLDIWTMNSRGQQTRAQTGVDPTMVFL